MFEQFISAHLLAPEYLGWLGQGFVITLLISFWTILAATLLGFLLGWFSPRRGIVTTILMGAGIVGLMGVSVFILWQFKAIVPVAAIVAAFVGAAMVGRLARAYGFRE